MVFIVIEKPTYWQQYRLDLIEGAEIFMARFKKKKI
jgi:hypothetical protein